MTGKATVTVYHDSEFKSHSAGPGPVLSGPGGSQVGQCSSTSTESRCTVTMNSHSICQWAMELQVEFIPRKLFKKVETRDNPGEGLEPWH